MPDAIHNIIDGFGGASRLEQLNFVLNLLGVWLMVRRKIAAFPVGMVAVAVQGVLFFRARIYADALLQGFFFVTLGWGWWHWTRGRESAPVLPVTRLSAYGYFATIGVATMATVAWALALRQWTDAAIPWRDAFIAAFSVAAQVLQARKKIENWALWIVVNLVAVASYWSVDLAYTAFLYAIYIPLAIAGWASWRKAMA